jgi:hypothetical protein
MTLGYLGKVETPSCEILIVLGDTSLMMKQRGTISESELELWRSDKAGREFWWKG